MYEIILIMAGIAYCILEKALTKNNICNDWLAKAIGINNIGKLSFIICALAITLAFIHTYIEYIIIENEKKASNN